MGQLIQKFGNVTLLLSRVFRMAQTIATWGSIQITDQELLDLNFTYGLRYAKLITVYYYPIVQYVGKDITRLSFSIRTTDPDKMVALWNLRWDLVNSMQTFTLGDANYGSFYLESTKVSIEQYETQRTDDLSLIVTPSVLSIYKIDIEAISELPPII